MVHIDLFHPLKHFIPRFPSYWLHYCQVGVMPEVDAGIYLPEYLSDHQLSYLKISRDCGEDESRFYWGDEIPIPIRLSHE
jgi:hypothetical protein